MKQAPGQSGNEVFYNVQVVWNQLALFELVWECSKDVLRSS